MADKLSLNVETADHDGIESIKVAYPFATTHAIALIAFREGLELLRREPDRIVARFNLRRSRRATGPTR